MLHLETILPISIRAVPAGGRVGGKLLRVVLLLSFMVLSSGLWYLGWLQNNRLGAENGPVEWVQIAILSFAAMVSIFHMFRSAPVVQRITWMAVATLCLSIVVREMDIAEFPFQSARSVERIARLGVVVAWVALGIFAVKHRSALWTFTRAMRSSWPTVLMILGIGLYISTWPFDHIKFIEKQASRFIEELIEFHATVMMLLAALAAPAAFARHAESAPDNDSARS